MAITYAVVSGNNEIVARDDVVVNEVESISTPRTAKWLKGRIANIDAKVAALTTEKTDYQTRLAALQVENSKVTLKVAQVI